MREKGGEGGGNKAEGGVTLLCLAFPVSLDLHRTTMQPSGDGARRTSSTLQQVSTSELSFKSVQVRTPP